MADQDTEDKGNDFLSPEWDNEEEDLYSQVTQSIMEEDELGALGGGLLEASEVGGWGSMMDRYNQETTNNMGMFSAFTEDATLTALSQQHNKSLTELGESKTEVQALKRRLKRRTELVGTMRIGMDARSQTLALTLTLTLTPMPSFTQPICATSFCSRMSS